MLLEQLTNDRVTAEADRLSLLPQEDWVVGQQGASMAMAAFLHPAPGGGRFNADRLGAWYCAEDIDTAIDETVHHHVRRLAHSAEGFHTRIQMRELLSTPAAEFHDIRGEQASRADLYALDDYSASQAFGEELRASGSNGLLYDSVRRAGGRNLVVFRPRLLPPIVQGDHYEYVWTGNPEPQIAKLTLRG